MAASRVLFVMDGKVYAIDQDGADQRLVSSSDHSAMSPAWAADGRRFAYMEFWEGHGRLFLQDVASGKRTAVATSGQALDFTPRSEEHTSELQSHVNLVCRLLLEKKNI